MDPAALTCEDFVPHVGDAFGIADVEGIGALVLERATPLGTSFELHFTGPPEPVLASSVHALRHDDLGTVRLRLEPDGADEHAARYRAVLT